MPTINATLDLAAAQTQWQQTKQAIATLRGGVEGVQQAIGTVTVTGVAGPGGTVTFTPNTTQVQAALNQLRQQATDVVAAVEALQVAMANLPVATQVQ